MKTPSEILLVEDNEGDIELTRIAFEEGNLPCHISVARNGEEAMDFLEKRDAFASAPTPALILLDINMPRMDGIQFLKVVKADPRFKMIPVIMLTSSGAPGDIKICYSLHANCYIVKPNGVDQLVKMATQIETFWSGLAKLPREAVA